MELKVRYERFKEKLLSDPTICKANRKLFEEFFAFEEHKLKRKNQLRALDVGCYRTLYTYIMRFHNVNMWFHNKPWKDLTREDIQRVYDDLEEGRITTQRGLPFEDRGSYYNKVFKSKPFHLAGRAEVAREVIEYYSNPKKEVRFITEETFRRMVSVLSQSHHLLLFWIAWDIGENVDALLKLSKRDFTKEVNSHTKEPEYLVNLPQHKLKRSRTARTEPTLYAETVRYLDIVFESLQDDDLVFGFGYRQALKLMHAVVKKTDAKCQPANDRVSWKDLRSGMACHLLKSGWTRDEVNARLGHTPNSSALNAYINYMALDRQRPKKKLLQTSLEALRAELEEAKQRERLTGERLQRQMEEAAAVKVALGETQRELTQVARAVEFLREGKLRVVPLSSRGNPESDSVEPL